MCRIEGCANPRRSSKKDVCEKHYYRFRRTGSYELLDRPPVERPGCSVDGCERTSRVTTDGGPMCDAHYKRILRTGKAGPAEIKRVREERGICSVDGCGNPDDGQNELCKLHGTRMRRTGDPLKYTPHAERNFPRGEAHAAWTGDQASYSAVHVRLRRVRGKASTHSCADCGGRAAQWSYGRNSETERQSDYGPYSTNLDDYEPRCVPCHKRFDLASGGAA